MRHGDGSMFRRLTKFTSSTVNACLTYAGWFRCADCGALKRKEALYWHGYPFPKKVCRPCYRKKLYPVSDVQR